MDAAWCGVEWGGASFNQPAATARSRYPHLRRREGFPERREGIRCAPACRERGERACYDGGGSLSSGCVGGQWRGCIATPRIRRASRVDRRAARGRQRFGRFHFPRVRPSRSRARRRCVRASAETRLTARHMRNCHLRTRRRLLQSRVRNLRFARPGLFEARLRVPFVPDERALRRQHLQCRGGLLQRQLWNLCPPWDHV
jgi:hypothetical protein